MRAHDQLITDAVEFLSRANLKSNGMPGQVVSLALSQRVLQLASAIQSLLEAGYGAETHALARAQLSAVGSLVAVVDGDPDGRALSYVQHARRFRERLLERAVKYEIILEDVASDQRDQARRAEDAQLEKFAADGIVPARLGESDRTWHGLGSEAALFARMGMPHIYELDYAWLSEEVHVGASALSEAVEGVLQGDLGVGPRGQVPSEVVLSAAQAVPEMLAQLNILFGLDRRDEIMAIKNRCLEAIRAEQRASGTSDGIAN